MDLRVIRFYMQMPCEYWCFPVDELDLLFSTVVFSAVNQAVFYLKMRHCHCYPGLKGTLHRDEEPLAFFAEVSSFSKSILNPWQDIVGPALEDKSLHCMRIPPCLTVSTLSVFQRITVVKELIFPLYCFVLGPWCTQSSWSNSSLFFPICCFSLSLWTLEHILDWFPLPCFPLCVYTIQLRALKGHFNRLHSSQRVLCWVASCPAVSVLPC